ncbi:unnamed protein product [Prunus armeniaca]|uniref:Uncharacterized protein n=1 Tax=Prunus armeniaca TaxID=36596 RepID=A0A6J5X0W7_PRUAR|nr:unnamed protein product [Prunus armeniaca]
MSGEELAGPPSTKAPSSALFFICTVGINKWREIQRKSILQQQQQQQQQQLPENAANALE